jgi:hypothetical protein
MPTPVAIPANVGARSDIGANGDAVEEALARALGEATAAGKWDVVSQLARELEARRLVRAGNVVSLRDRKRGER